MRARWIVAAIALVAIVCSIAYAAQLVPAGPSKIAFISARRLLAESADVQSAVGRLRAEHQETLTELKAKQQSLQETRRKLAASTGTDRATLQQQEKEQVEELQRATSQAQADLQASQRETMAVLQSHLKPVLDELAKSESLDAILNADVAVFWGSTKLDLTPVVLERLNAKPAGDTAKP